MKYISAVALCTLLASTLLTACSTPAPPPDIARYTADQVIAVAKSYAGDTCGSTKWQQDRYPKPTWKVEYVGQGVW